MLREVENLAYQYIIAPETIYFGDGTPTALSSDQLRVLLEGIHRRLDSSRVVEWTIEANPGSVSRRKADVLRSLGVTRISLGVQSWDDRLLQLLGREHDSAKAFASYEILRATGF